MNTITIARHGDSFASLRPCANTHHIIRGGQLGWRGCFHHASCSTFGQEELQENQKNCKITFHIRERSRHTSRQLSTHGSASGASQYHLLYQFVFDGVEIVAIGLKKAPASATAILLTCKRTFTEALQLFYAATIFQANDVGDLKRWLVSVGSLRTILVKEVHFERNYLLFYVGVGDEFKKIMEEFRKELNEEEGILLREDVVKVRTRESGPRYLVAAELEDDDYLLD